MHPASLSRVSAVLGAAALLPTKSGPRGTLPAYRTSLEGRGGAVRGALWALSAALRAAAGQPTDFVGGLMVAPRSTTAAFALDSRPKPDDAPAR